MSSRTIEIEKGSPTYAALNPNTSKIYISYQSEGLILIISIIKGEIEAKIPANRPGSIDINSITNKIYVSAAYGVYEIDGSTNKCNLINKRPETSTQRQGIQDSPSSLRDHLFAIDSITNEVYVSKYENESISVYNGNESNRLEDSVNFKASKWEFLSSSTMKPSFVLVNEDLRILYVKADVTVSAGGGGGAFGLLMVVDLNSKRPTNKITLPSTNTQIGFAFNRTTNTIYMKNYSGKTIVRYDGYLGKILHKTTLENTSAWKRLFTDYTWFAEVIVTNHINNKVYISDSKSNLLYEIDG